MLTFEYVLILLAAILLSNLINRFMPVLSAPIIQILLGVLIRLIPFGAFGFEFELEPELFFVLFIAPLVFYTSMNLDKKAMWKMKGPIIGSAVALVILTVISVGYLVNILIPAIPLAAAFALIAALGPTDDVAVDAVSKRVNVPPRIMNILSGESIINDASGIVSFQFATAAVTSGAFSLSRAAGQFFLMALGGVFIGLAFTWLRSLFVNWLRSLGVQNVTLHILIGVLTPFIIYMIAEALSTSAILAVFAAGISHSFMREKFNPETIRLNISQESVWSVLSFTFDGIVFIILGTQLPDILKTINSGRYSIGGWYIALHIMALTLIFAFTRFIWWIVTVRKKTYQEPDVCIGKIKSGIIFSLAGARGTVTLVSVMSIPLLLSDGSEFPQRDLIILLASGVIVVSLLITNFILPLFVERKTETERNEKEQEAYNEIIQKVIDQLTAEVTDENRIETNKVVRNYFRRNTDMHKSRTVHRVMETERELLAESFLWEKENTLAQLNEGTIDKAIAEHFIKMFDSLFAMFSAGNNFFVKIWRFMKHIIRINVGRRSPLDNEKVIALAQSNKKFVIDKLRQMKTEENSPVIERLISLHETAAVGYQRVRKRSPLHPRAKGDLVLELTMKAFRLERTFIQEMFEAGRISWRTAKEMRGNIATLEAVLQSE